MRRGSSILCVFIFALTVYGIQPVYAVAPSYYNPSAAFDPVNNRFLVAYFLTGVTGFDLRAQLVNADGSLSGSSVLIAGGVVETATLQQYVAFDQSSARFLVVWHNSSVSGADIFGQFLDSSGALIGRDGLPGADIFSISGSMSDKKDPAVVNDSVNHFFLVVWTDYRNGASNSDLYGQIIIGNDGTLLGPVFPITPETDGRNQGAATLAYDNQMHRYLVAWEDERNVVTGMDIYGQIIDWNGSLFDVDGNGTGDTGDNFPIATEAGNQSRPVIAYDDVNSRFLVVWQDASGADNNIYGQFVDGQGQLRRGNGLPGTENFVISNAAGNQQGPSVTFDGVRDRYLVLWDDTSHISGQYVNYNGSLLKTASDTNFLITNFSGTEISPFVLFNPSDSNFLVSYVKSSTGVSNIGLSLLASIELPVTGQNVCYNSLGAVVPCYGSRQDGEVQAGTPWPVGRFTVMGDTIKDGLTGLTWLKNANCAKTVSYEGTYNGDLIWQKALNFVVAMNAGTYPSCDAGYNDWRLPNVRELGSLMRNAGVDNARIWLGTQGFTNMSDYDYWTSTTDPANTGNAFTTAYYRELSLSKSSPLYVLPVRGHSNGPVRVMKTGQTTSYDANLDKRDDGALREGAVWSSPRFVVSGECATDMLTGLTWVTSPDLIQRNWMDALDYASTLTLCGFSDWRLPNNSELRTLENYGEPSVTWLTGQGFSNVQSAAYWTATTEMFSKDWAWNSSIGAWMYRSTKTSSLYAWPVRGSEINGCINDHVSNLGSLLFPTIIEAYNAIFGSDYLRLHAISFPENLDLNRDVTVYLWGGYPCDFSGLPSSYSAVAGLTVSSGTVAIENIIIK